MGASNHKTGETYKKSNTIALIGSILLYVFFFGSIGWNLKTSKSN
jgi:hypothetical protein